jgi:flavin prenyltransferase
VMPPVPAFYQRLQSVEEIIDHLAARAIDLVGLPGEPLATEWDPQSHRQHAAAR